MLMPVGFCQTRSIHVPEPQQHRTRLEDRANEDQQSASPCHLGRAHVWPSWSPPKSQRPRASSSSSLHPLHKSQTVSSRSHKVGKNCYDSSCEEDQLQLQGAVEGMLVLPC